MESGTFTVVMSITDATIIHLSITRMRHEVFCIVCIEPAQYRKQNRDIIPPNRQRTIRSANFGNSKIKYKFPQAMITGSRTLSI